MPRVQTPAIDLLPILPELILAGTGLLVLLLEAAVRRVGHRTLFGISVVGVSAAAGAALALWSWEDSRTELTVLAGAVAVDRFTVAARLIVLAISVFGLLYGMHYFERVGEWRGEFYPLVLFATSGMTLITAASDLLLIFLALEILSLALYILAGFSFRLSAGEASMKYFLLGAFSSAFFLYGIAMAYGATGGTQLAGIARALSRRVESPAFALFAVGLLGIGFAFKVAAVPFHMWTPDVYQGAPTPVTAFMSAGTKVAAFAALVRVFDIAFQPLSGDWTPAVAWLAGITVVVGSLLAVAQSDVKRMLAYSSIAHAGFVLTGVVGTDQAAVQAVLFYLLTYAATILGAFGVVMVVSGRGERATELSAYTGLARRSPVLAALMTLFLLSAAGIPPTAGFIAKVSVFGAAVRAGSWELVLAGVLASVVAAFFYLRVIVLMYMRDPEEEAVPEPAPVPVAALAIPAVVTLVLGVLPQVVLGVLERAAVLRW